ncbi:MAG: phosphate ABC transporter permease subunit PstC [Bacteroidetes bacterium GWC2_33_15]|nr:MAG: phosphate ABC transporter permease subunit PstC [Bacteroidetes bacterium GWA2_33_15]OFX51663.1 MAG: phosphate ABC transporter permease subunit PstC [Bacteroidetes bacterium GWC2_33_15]OFX66275.1 MAG: phosphate ABC transporter permease subunit PstC [Bacteroidetes bacterium GWB2_32_14]OFX66963.1 MAG: phosphate ABC transporter permease subunit PstC [Bacteroidetes bacterium GWD2_33_33]HAN17661.1 phosphate ABC transporter permease subunit PstC [Bacteroidales bacterium]
MKSEKITKYVLFAVSLIILLIFAGMVFSLAGGAMPVFKEYGLKFIFSADWNPTTGRESYGALPFIAGTLITSILALLICFPLSFSTSLFIAEYYHKTRVASVLGTMVDLLAGIPSIVYGLWGFYALRPVIIALGLSDQGFGIFTSSIILAIMIIPYATSLSNEIITMVPNELKEAAYSLGATRFEVIFNVIIPNARSGIVASYILALGRALGETMAVTMLIGNANIIPDGLFSTGNTMASLIANQFGEADGLKLSALIAIGLLLFLITAVVNAIGKYIIKKLS